MKIIVKGCATCPFYFSDTKKTRYMVIVSHAQCTHPLPPPPTSGGIRYCPLNSESIEISLHPSLKDHKFIMVAPDLLDGEKEVKRDWKELIGKDVFLRKNKLYKLLQKLEGLPVNDYNEKVQNIYDCFDILNLKFDINKYMFVNDDDKWEFRIEFSPHQYEGYNRFMSEKNITIIDDLLNEEELTDEKREKLLKWYTKNLIGENGIVVEELHTKRHKKIFLKNGRLNCVTKKLSL